MSACIMASYTKFFWEVPETHRNILDQLGGVATPVGRVPTPKTGLS